MIRRTSILATLSLALLLALPLAASASTVYREGSHTLPDGTVMTLSKVSGIAPLAGGTWNAGCRIAATNILGNEIYHFIIWQQFTSDGTKITSLPTPTYSAGTDLGWALTSHSQSHAWLNTSHKDAQATGNYTFTQYVGGQPYKSVAGWVRVNVHYQGTWDCQSS